MIKIRHSLLLIFILAIGCSSSVSDFEDKIEARVAEITPKNSGHSEFVGMGKSLADFRDLALRFFTTEINCRTDSDTTHFKGLFDLCEENLIERVGMAEQFVVIDFQDERNLVCPASSHRTKHPIG